MIQITVLRDVISTGGQGTSSEYSGPQYLKPFEKSATFVWELFPQLIETKILALPNPPYNKKFREKETYKEEYTKKVHKDLHRSN